MHCSAQNEVMNDTDLLTIPTPPTGSEASTRQTKRHGFGHHSGFWVVATAFLIATGFTVVTTPLWSIYQQREGFSTFMITVAFASYAVGVLVSLFLAGHISDWVGRRVMLVPALLTEAIAAVLFLVWNDLAGLLVARVVTGIGLGMLTATATAHMSELHSRAHPERDDSRPTIVATAANIGGFGVGVLITSALIQWLPAPTITPFVIFLILLLLAAIAVSLVPETVDRSAQRRRYRPQRVSIPEEARGHYFAAAALAFSGFAVLGLFTSLAPSFVSDELHFESPLASGAVVFATFVSAAGSQIALRRLDGPASVIFGTSAYVLGFVAIIAGVSLVSLPLFLTGGVLAGGAAGILFSSAVTAAGHAAAAGNRGEAIAGIFLAAYTGLAVPVIVLGAATLVVSMSAALSVFAAFVTAIAVIATIVFARTRPSES